MNSVVALAAAILFLVPASAGHTASKTPASLHPNAGPANTSWTEYHFDDGHTGYDSTQPTMTGATTGWVSSTADDQIYGSPLIYNGLVYAATLNNTVYAFNQSNGSTAWSTHLGAPQTSGWPCGNVSPMGILGTPIIDTAGGRIYVAAEFTGGVYHVIGLNLATGVTEFDRTISIPGFDWTVEQERGALAFRNGVIYVPFGGRLGDCGNYHGYVVGVPTNTATAITWFQTPDSMIGIWAAGGPVIDDATGNIFATTGNGSCNSPQPNYNDAVIRLDPANLSAVADWFQPFDWQNGLCAPDLDLGGAGPLLISPNLLWQAGKSGGGYLLNPNNLGHVAGQLYPVGNVQADVCHGNHNDATFGAFAYAAPFVYLECDGNGLVAINVNTSNSTFTPCTSTSCGPPNWSAGGTLGFGPPIVAGGAVWVVDIGGSGLYAYDQATGTQLFHSSAFGVNNHFVSPSEASGQVFVSSHTVVRSFTMTTAGVSFTPARLDFNGQAAGTTSAVQTVTLHNNQPTTLSVTTAAITGANAADYIKGTDTCTGATVAANGGTCTVQVSFKPPSLGGFPANLTFTDNGPGSPQNVPLNGMGAIDNQTHLYTLDRFGGLHADGTASPLSSSAYWGWNIARGASLFPDATGGYTLDGYGGLHAFGSAPFAAAPAYWGGWDIARGVVLAPWSTSSTPAGWTLDGYGGIHQFGGAPAIAGYSYFGFDIARGLVILPDSTSSSVAGYTLDGYGGVHPFGGAAAVSNAPYWGGWDIAHSITLTPNASKTNPAGWILDGFGGVHPFGNAPSVVTTGYWPGWDVARSIVAWTGSGTGGWVMDAYGGLHPFGSAPTVSPFPYWGWNAAASLGGPVFSAGARAS